MTIGQGSCERVGPNKSYCVNSLFFLKKKKPSCLSQGIHLTIRIYRDDDQGRAYQNCIFNYLWNSGSSDRVCQSNHKAKMHYFPQIISLKFFFGPCTEHTNLEYSSLMMTKEWSTKILNVMIPGT